MKTAAKSKICYSLNFEYRMGLGSNPDSRNPEKPKIRQIKSRDAKIPTHQNPNPAALPVAERFCSRTGRREVPGSIVGRACRPSRSELSLVYSETRINT